MSQKSKKVVPAEQQNKKQRIHYLRRLSEVGVPESPAKAQIRSIRQFQLAHLAATIAPTLKSKNGPSDCAALAMQYWNAAGKSLLIESQARVLVRGVFVLQRKEWEAHARALIAFLDDSDGALPGQKDSEQETESFSAAQTKAGRAVADVWEFVHREDMLRALFSPSSVKKGTVGKEFTALLEFAKVSFESDGALDWQSDGEDRLKASVVAAWYPLNLWDEDIGKGPGLAQVKSLIEKPASAPANNFVGLFAPVARWLTVMRQKQLSTSKTRY
jgi:hypothetical protein